MAMAENRKGSMQPMSSPTSTIGFAALMLSIPILVRKAAVRASAVRAAEPIAKPLPIAAVVLPTASSLSVRARMSRPSWAISAMPPALSATGP